MPRPAATTDDQRIRAARMSSLLLDGRSTGRTVSGVVQWFGAMQGQDFASVTWSLGLRTGQTRDEVHAAFESGEILRTWPMRGTLHVVPGADARWMIEHLGARALRGAEARRQFLGLSAHDADRSADVIGEALAGGPGMTRAECVAALEAAGISGAGQRAYHLLWYASQKGITCVGPQRGKEQTFVLLDEFAPPGPDLDRPAALATIAERFVRSHAPVSAHDFARWADLTMADARAGLAAADGVVPHTIGARDLFVAEATLDAAPADRRRRARPAGPRPARVRRVHPGVPRPHRPARRRAREARGPRGQRGVREHTRRGRSGRRDVEAPRDGATGGDHGHALHHDHHPRPSSTGGVARGVRHVRRQGRPDHLVRTTPTPAALPLHRGDPFRLRTF